MRNKKRKSMKNTTGCKIEWACCKIEWAWCVVDCYYTARLVNSKLVTIYLNVTPSTTFGNKETVWSSNVWVSVDTKEDALVFHREYTRSSDAKKGCIRFIHREIKKVSTSLRQLQRNLNTVYPIKKEII